MRGRDGGGALFERAGTLKICDVTQFYSPRSGGVKRYLHEKIDYVQQQAREDEHVLIVPGPRNEVTTVDRTRAYTIAAPIVSRRTQYRALLNLRAVGEIIECERPDIIESADPYQLGWKVAAISAEQRIPAVAFYHSDFAAAYLRPAAARFGGGALDAVMRGAQRYVRNLYNRFEATLVPSPAVAEVLRMWGVHGIREVDLGVNTEVFNPGPDDAEITRRAHNIPPGCILLLCVGRLAAEKNTTTLLAAFSLLVRRRPGAFHLLVVGDGQQRDALRAAQAETGAITWLSYCADSRELAQLYRAADLLVHPGTQETFGLVALESQACGTPVIGIRGSAMDRIIRHDQSCWATSNTATELAAAIERCSALDLVSLGATAAVAVAEHDAWPSVFGRLFSVYREVRAGYRRARPR